MLFRRVRESRVVNRGRAACLCWRTGMTFVFGRPYYRTAVDKYQESDRP